MDIEETIDTLNHLIFCGGCTTGPCKDCDRKNAKDTAIQGLKELQQYRKIGTVERFAALEEQMKPKKPVEDKDKYYCCPNCGRYVVYNEFLTDDDILHCEICGQALKWGD